MILDLTKKQMVYEIFSSENDIDNIINNHCKHITSSGSRYIISYFSFLEERFLRDFARNFYDFIEKNRINAIIELLYVTNSAVSVLEFKNDSDLEKVRGFASKIEFRNQSVSISYQDDIFVSLKSCFKKLRSKLTRYQKIQLVNQELIVQEINNYVSFMHSVPALSKELIAYAQNNDMESVLRLIDNLYEPIKDIELFRTYGINMVSNLMTALNCFNCDNLAEFFNSIYKKTNLKEAKAILKQMIINLLFASSKAEDDIIEKVKSYVNEHLSDSRLSLKWMAENYLYMNVDYLSRQFINKTGEKFSSYLNRTRIERAKKLLLQYDGTKIYIVAEQVGCGHNPRYFSQIFKKYTGMTPSQYISAKGKYN